MKLFKLRFRFILLFTVTLYTTVNCLAQDDSSVLYQQNCAQCHGSDLNGGNATSLIDGIWQFGAEDGYMRRNIKFGIPHLGMPSYEKTLSDTEINSILKYIREAEKDAGAKKPETPETLETMDYRLHVEDFAVGLEIPWAIDFIDASTSLNY